jgi:hypothetical protein
MWLVSSRHPPAPMAWAGFCSGCPRSNAHPVTRRPGTPHTNFFACASASSPVTAWSCRSNRPSRALRADPSKRHPPDRFRLRPTSSRMRLVRTDKASLDRAPLLRFRPLQHTLTATRCPRQPASGRSRFDVSASRGPRLFGDLHLALVRAVFRRAESLRWCSVSGGRLREERSGRIRRLCFGIATATGRRPVAPHLVRLRPAVRVRAV